MRFTCYGCRGSYPIVREDYMRYGGNTTCYFIEEKDTKIVIDGGTGITLLGRYLFENYFPDPMNIDIFISHGHWDHIIGLPVFRPFYYEMNNCTIHAPGGHEDDVSKMIVKLHQVSNTSVPFESLKANISYKNLKSRARLELKNAIVHTYQLNHPSMDLGYRITSKETKKSITILTDVAPIENNYLAWGWKEMAKGREKRFEQRYYEGLIRFALKSDLLIIDTHFTDKDIIGKEHWGHSTASIAMKIAKDSESKNLMLTHHNPDYCDKDMDLIFEDAKKKAKAMGINLLIAIERDSHEL